MPKSVSAIMIALSLLLSPGAAKAEDMMVSAFLAKADALQSKGMAAMFSRDIRLLQAEVARAATAYRADVAAGRPPRSCPPPKDSVKLTSDELLTHFRTIPLQQRPTTTVRVAFFEYASKRFPCR